ncbi:MAG: hypothetical protein KDD36_13250 [Flavobacteriales bacterium]|nr:hypothetical protein [Flavobacteriales bacterium]
MKTFILTTALLAGSMTIQAQDFPKELLSGEHHTSVGLQFDEPASNSVDIESECWKQAKVFVEEDVKAMGLPHTFTYLRAAKGAGGIAGKFAKEDVRCLLQFTFFKYPKKGGERDEYAGKLDIVEIDENGKKGAKSVRFTIGGDGGEKMSYPELLEALKKHLAEGGE